jgi:hypothetical protein
MILIFQVKAKCSPEKKKEIGEKISELIAKELGIAPTKPMDISNLEHAADVSEDEEKEPAEKDDDETTKAAFELKSKAGLTREEGAIVCKFKEEMLEAGKKLCEKTTMAIADTLFDLKEKGAPSYVAELTLNAYVASVSHRDHQANKRLIASLWDK